jgi:ATP adenylyltransferase
MPIMAKKRYSVLLEHGRTQEQIDNMKRIKKDKVDPFEWKHFTTYHREPILRKGKYWLVSPNDFPYEGTKLHLLLVYKDAVKYPSQTHPRAWVELQEHVAWVEKKYRLQGGMLAMRFGEPENTGGSVDHLHLHIIVGDKKKIRSAKKLRIVAGYEVPQKKKRRAR